jgi:plasmid stabilization system protein ParE
MRSFGRQRGITRARLPGGVVVYRGCAQSVDEVVEFPLAAETVRAGIRKKVLRHFSYNLFYAVEASVIVIVAVAHQRKRPSYWRARLKPR